MQAALDDAGTLLDVPERAEADTAAGFIAATNLLPYMNAASYTHLTLPTI